jgi:hypothetical protein
VSPHRHRLRPVFGHKPVAGELPLPFGLFPGQVRRPLTGIAAEPPSAMAKGHIAKLSIFLGV